MSYPQRIYVLPARQQRQQMVQQPQRLAPVQTRPAPKRALPTEAIVAELLGDDMGPSGPRKRERLTHLSAEEKMERRKQKNRVAAQNARDKKKERSGKIEDVMRDLVEENRRLVAENEMLRKQNQELLMKQNQVQYQNDENDSNIYQNVAYEEEVVGEVDVMAPEDCAFESAAFINVPQQREQAQSTTAITNSRTRSTESNKKSSFKIDSYLTMFTMLCQQVDQMVKVTSNSSESSTTSKAHPESSIASLLNTLRKNETAMHRLLQADSHLLKHVKHFRRVH